MRALLLYHLYSGQAWFAAGLVFLTIAALDFARVFESREPARRAARVVLMLLFPIALLSGTPVPLVLSVPLAASTIAWAGLFLAGRPARVLGLAAAFCVLAALFAELPYHSVTRCSGGGAPKAMVVLGDSLSAGGFGEARTWPELVGEQIGIPLRNLARPGETTESALLDHVPGLRLSSKTLVIIEIGGNDMLEGTSPAVFAGNLEKLLTIVGPHAPADDRDIVMFELPLLPGKWSYGAHQRRLAKKYGVRLLPKRLLARVLSEDRFVTDGLHLTSAGHEELARMVAAALECGGGAKRRRRFSFRLGKTCKPAVSGLSVGIKSGSFATLPHSKATRPPLLDSHHRIA